MKKKISLESFSLSGFKQQGREQLKTKGAQLVTVMGECQNSSNQSRWMAEECHNLALWRGETEYRHRLLGTFISFHNKLDALFNCLLHCLPHFSYLRTVKNWV